MLDARRLMFDQLDKQPKTRSGCPGGCHRAGVPHDFFGFALCFLIFDRRQQTGTAGESVTMLYVGGLL
jgi:hypothetical protein